MKQYLYEFFEEFCYPQEAQTVLTLAYDKISSDADLKCRFEKLLQYYKEDKNYDFEELLRSMNHISQAAGFHEYTGVFLMLICMSKTLKEYYRTAGLSEKIWHTCMCDLKWKLDECKCVYNIWGTFVAPWFSWFFQLKRFGFGKLQFELIKFNGDYEKNGIILNPDSPVVNVHIPRTGTKLDEESLRRSYREASAFYQKEFGDGPVVFVCYSWLLFPRNKEVVSPNSNLYRFISDYDIVSEGIYEDYSEVWRLFDVNYNGDVEQLPQDTSLRRAYADWIRKGEKTGYGFGVYVFNT